MLGIAPHPNPPPTGGGSKSGSLRYSGLGISEKGVVKLQEGFNRKS
jgi:hypothetical protein